jgi:1-acyl-sn-glycerol-3-phosphate acyltransferase
MCVTPTRAIGTGRTVGAGLGHACFWLVRSALVGFFRIYCRVRIDGLEHVPESGAFIVAPIHRSNVDFIFAAMVTKRRVRFMVKDSVWKVPLLGRIIETMGAVRVERGTADRAAIRAVEDALGAGEPVVIFPEGTRQSGATVAALFDGVAYVSHRSGAPIVPVGIAGSADVMPKGSRRIRPTRVVVTVGRPLPPEPTGNGRASRRHVRQQTSSLAVALQHVFDRATATHRVGEHG